MRFFSLSGAVMETTRPKGARVTDFGNGDGCGPESREVFTFDRIHVGLRGTVPS
jgi:hypothetical protein